MTRAYALFLVTASLFHVFMPERDAASSDPVNYGILFASILAVLVTVAIAVWQGRDLRRYRRAEQEVRAESSRMETERQARLARRESWDPVFRETQEALRRLEDIESEVRQQGPLTRKAIDAAELGRLRWRLQNIAERSPEALHAPLRNVAEAIGPLRRVDIPSDDEVIEKYTAALTREPRNLPPEIWPSAMGARAVEQFKAAEALHAEIGKAWDAVRTERGGES